MDHLKSVSWIGFSQTPRLTMGSRWGFIRVFLVLTGLLNALNAGAADSDFTYSAPGLTVTILGYKGPGGNVVVPETIEGKPVTVLGGNLSGVFAGLANVTSVTIPNSVSRIGGVAFSDCTGLTNITIPASVLEIGDGALRGCTSLPAITVDPLNKVYASIDGVLVQVDDCQQTLIQCPAGRAGHYVVPDIINTIGAGAFDSCRSLANVTIPCTVTNIWGAAFFGCTGLTGVYFEGDAPPVPDVLFLQANNVTVYYLAGTKGWGATYAGRPTALWVKQPTTGDYEYTITDSAATITKYVGSGGSVVIPETIEGMQVASIGYGAFYGRKDVTDVTIPDSVSSLGRWVFNGCIALTNVTIGNGATNIGIRAFARCGSLTHIAIPDNVNSIGWGALTDCTNLASITLSSKLTSIEYMTFFRCKNLTSITIPNSVANLGETAFSFCGSLKKIIIPNGVTNIGSSLFFSCSALKSVYFMGNAPLNNHIPIFGGILGTVYYRAGTTGWGTTFDGWPTVIWQPNYEEWTKTAGLLDQFPNASAETDDADQDGMSNLAEMQAGTDPIKLDSKLAFEKVPRPSDLVDDNKTAIDSSKHAFYFQTVPGKHYEIQRMAAFGEAWQTETNVTATTTQKRVVVDKPVDQGFYRVVLMP